MIQPKEPTMRPLSDLFSVVLSSVATIALGTLSICLLSATGLTAAEIPFSTEQTVDSAWNGAADLVWADVDTDGDLDVVSAGRDVNRVAVWRQDFGGAWTELTVDSSITGPISVVAADFDGDHDLDIAAGTTGGEIFWYENLNGAGSSWTEHSIFSYGMGEVDVSAGDVDSDGRMDLISAVDETPHQIVWWRQVPGTGISTTAAGIATGFQGASSTFPIDMDGDGDVDVVATASINNDVALV